MKRVKNRLKRIDRSNKGAFLFVAYSGGKDSTALFLAAKETKGMSCELGLIYADTLVEIPWMHDHTLSTIEHAKACGLNVVVISPPLDDTFWVNILGKGYPPPRPWFRWCQQRLKVRPVKRALSGVEGVVVVASRKDESAERSKIMRSNVNGKLYEILNGGNGVRMFAPMYDVTLDEVWGYLTSKSDNAAREVVKLYEKAGGPCVRFGCWCCTVIKRDKTMEALAGFDRGVRKLLEYKQLLLELCYRQENRLPFRRNGKPAKNGMGMLTLSVRKMLLDELLKLERRLNRCLITPAEVDEIWKIWEREGEEPWKV